MAGKMDGDVDGQSWTVKGRGQGVGKETQKDSDREWAEQQEEGSGWKLMHNETCAPGDR